MVMKFLRLSVSLLLLLVLLGPGCGGDLPFVKKDEVKGYFTVQGASFVDGKFPAGKSSGPAITTIGGNAYVLPGGSSQLNVGSSDSPSHILVGVSGKSGYYKSSYGNSTIVVIVIFIEPGITETTFEILVALQGSDGTVGTHRTLPVTLVEAGTGRLQVSLSWDKPVDLDLYLVEPNGTTIYYGSTSSSSGGELDVDSNAACNIDNINNENITYPQTAVLQTGLYIVRVNLYAVCSVTQQINFVTTARLNGAFVNTVAGQNPFNGFYPAGSSSQYGGISAGAEVMRFNVSSNKDFETQSWYRMEFPDDNPEKSVPLK